MTYDLMELELSQRRLLRVAGSDGAPGATNSPVVRRVPPRPVSLRAGQSHHRIARQMLGAVPPVMGCVPGRVQAAERAERHLLVGAGRYVFVEADAQPPPLEDIVIARLLRHVEGGAAYLVG